MIKVTFRKVYDGEIIAVFAAPHSRHGFDLVCYAHVGQHQSCDYEFYRDCTAPATPEEYAELLDELRGVGYRDLQIVRHLPPLSRIFGNRV